MREGAIVRTTKLDERFFDSTRGRIVIFLRGTAKTVNELAKELEMTDNGVRAQLLLLERDGLVCQSGIQRGYRKPHFAYELTPEAELLFPKAYDALLNQLIAVLKGRLSPDLFEEVLREVGRAMAAQQGSRQEGEDLETRLQRVLKALEVLGGCARIEREDGKLLIRSSGCPLAEAVSEHPEICELVEALVAELAGLSVSEHCDREKSPKCCFEVTYSE